MKKELIDAIKNSNCTDRVLVWSACRKTDDIIEEFRKNGIEVCGYIDSRADEIKTFNNLKVYDKDVIKNDRYFVFIGLTLFYPGIVNFIEECGYREFENYWYPNHLFTIDPGKNYNDVYGNSYQIREDSACHFKLEIGGGSKCTIGNGNKINETVHIKVIDSSVLEIGDDNIFSDNCNLVSAVHSNMKIGSKCDFWSGNRILFNVQIDDHINAGPRNQIISSMHNKIVLGRDCMLSDSIYIRAGSGHNLYNLETNENITMSLQKDVILHEHVWVGEHAYIFSGADIGSGSVIGANTFVNKKFPNNVAFAGNPARIVKNRIAWRGEDAPIYNSYEDFKEFNFTEQKD